MTEKVKPNPEKKGKQGVEEKKKPLTPKVPEKGTEGDPTPIKELKGDQLPPEPIDYKKKFGESSREAQRLVEQDKLSKEKIKELEVELRKKERDAPPSDEELQKRYPDWEYLDLSKRDSIKKEIDREKRLRKVEEQLAWENDFKSLLKKPEFSALKEREDEFKGFAYDYTEIKDLTILAQSFLFEKGVKVEEPEIIPERKGLEKPTKGPIDVPTSELTLEQIKTIRKEQPRRYIKMIQQGKIKKVPEK